MFRNSNEYRIMNKIILNKGEYTFDASTKKVSVLEHKEIFKKEYLLLITNVTTNDIIYNFGCDGFGGVIATSVITLEYDTTSMADSDELQIVLYTEQTDAEAINKSLLEGIKINTASQVLLLEELKLQTKYLRKIYNPE